MRVIGLICLASSFLLISSLKLVSQTSEDKLFTKYAQKSLPQLKELLAIPNDAHFPADIEKNVQWCESAFNKRGFTTQRLETSEAPLLLASRKGTNSKKTVLVYLQVDGQPVDPNHLG